MKVREFEISFRQLYVPLGMYALRIVGDTEDAEDLVENTFLKTWQSIQDGTDIDNFKAFMYRAVRNECLDFLRKKKETVDIDEILEISDEEVDTSERDAKVWKALDDLPEKCRKIFLMSKRDGMSNEEIAEELDISIKTVKNHLSSLSEDFKHTFEFST